MRLLNTSTWWVQDFIGRVPEYAILSHTWGEEEVSYQEVINGTGRKKKGWLKIRNCCALAAKDGWKYVWIDTCCINKESSAELSEAINSMFAWYKQAAVCYVYLEDVKKGSPVALFHKSRWFTRGWTLQELLAPRFLIFLDHSWFELGTKYSLRQAIFDATGIEHHHISDFKTSCVAVKMSWAANRQTTRIEDQAYCLLGLFGINMPLLYGEGNKAFIRLQRKIIASSNDDSIFAWKDYWTGKSGILAASPQQFSECGDVRPFNHVEAKPEFTKAKDGIHFTTELYQSKSEPPIYLFPLNCMRSTRDMPCSVYLKPLDISHNIFDRTFSYRPGLGFNLTDPLISKQWEFIGVKNITVKQVDEEATDRGSGSEYFVFAVDCSTGIKLLSLKVLGTEPGIANASASSRKTVPPLQPPLEPHEQMIRFDEHLLVRVEMERRGDAAQFEIVISISEAGFTFSSWQFKDPSHTSATLESVLKESEVRVDEALKIRLQPTPTRHEVNSLWAGRQRIRAGQSSKQVVITLDKSKQDTGQKDQPKSGE